MAPPMFSGGFPIKNGNNGSVSCQRYCTAAAYGGPMNSYDGCVAAYDQSSNPPRPVSCLAVLGAAFGREVTCVCKGDPLTKRMGTNGKK